MNPSIREQIFILSKIQKIESERLELINKIEKIIPMELASIEAKVQQCSNDVENDKKLLVSFEKKYHESEINLNLIDSNIIKSKTKISQIKSNKEYKLNLKEIDILQEKQNHLENDMLKYLKHIEDIEISISKKIKLLIIHKEKLGGKKKLILNEKVKTRKLLNDLWEEIKNARKSLSSKILLSFDDISKKIKNKPVAEVSNSTCFGCNIQVPYQLFIELQKYDDQLKFCPHCGRIIYWDNR